MISIVSPVCRRLPAAERPFLSSKKYCQTPSPEDPEQSALPIVLSRYYRTKTVKIPEKRTKRECRKTDIRRAKSCGPGLLERLAETLLDLMDMILLVNPPVAKPSEPPAGIARLAGSLAHCGITCEVLDANIEGLLYLSGMSLPPDEKLDIWSERAFNGISRNLQSLRDPDLYGNRDRYSRAVKDIGRVLDRVSPLDVTVKLSDYDDRHLSPLKSSDLIAAAERPEMNPFYPFFRARLSGILQKKEVPVVGISLNYLSQALCAFSIIGFLRREFPEITIVLGGGLVTSWMKKPGWHDPFAGLVDHLVSGPGEARLLSILGVDSPEGESVIPAYGCFPCESYLAPGFVLPYSASSGCYWNRCSFCPEKAEKNPYRPLPPHLVTDQLRKLAGEIPPVLVHLLDNAVSPALLNALAAERFPFPWYGFARIGRQLADPDFCGLLKGAGCVMLQLGVESGDQDVLDSMEKGISVEMASTVLKNLKRAGIATYVYLLFGTPDETEESARKTLEFTVRNSRFIDFLNLAIFNMPLCGERDQSIDTREFYRADLSLYTDFIHPKGWDRRRVRLFLDSEFRRHPAISPILKNDPPVFTSNHAPFFMMPLRRRKPPAVMIE